MGPTTIGKLFQVWSDRSGNRSALQEKKGGTWRDITWFQFGQTVRELAVGLIEVGLESRDRIAILSQNRPEWAFADLATLSADGIVVPVFETTTPEQVKYILRDSESKFVFVSGPDQLGKVLQVRGALPDLEKIILFDREGGLSIQDETILTLDGVLHRGKTTKHPEAFTERLDRTTPEDVATLIYTSGTTGQPKGVMLSHDNILSNCRAALDVMPIARDDIVLSVLPLSHAFERMAGYYSIMMAGGTIAFAESFDRALDNMLEVRPTVVGAVPRFFETIQRTILDGIDTKGALVRKAFEKSVAVGRAVGRLRGRREPIPRFLDLTHKICERVLFHRIHRRMGGRVRFFVSGGAPLAAETAEFLQAVGLMILEGYGLTETSPVISVNTPDNLRLGSVGQPLPGVEVKIAKDGEVLVRGPGVMKGYYGRPEATKETIDSDGWLYTGDIGYLDEDNYLHITERKGDVIVTEAGWNIAPQTLETLLKRNKYIEQVCVLGDRRKYLSSLIVPNFEALERFARDRGIGFTDRADLVAKPEVDLLFRSAVEGVNATVNQNEAIKRFRPVPNEFSEHTGELTPTLKVKRQVVDRKYKDLIDAMYADE